MSSYWKPKCCLNHEVTRLTELTASCVLKSLVSFSGDIQDPPGQGPVQPAVGDPASAGGLD